MFFGLAGITSANMNQIRKDSFCRKIGGDVYVFLFEIKSGSSWGSGMRPEILNGMAVKPNVSECTLPFEIKATFGRLMGSEHWLWQ